jgi:hyperosmotically inducible protein
MKTYSIFQAKSLFALSCLSAVLVLTACEQKGPAEKAGQKIDQAADSVGKKLESAKSEVDHKADTVGEFMDDAMITTKVKEAFLADDLLKVTQIEVTTVNGVVKLNGSLASEQLVAKAVELTLAQKNVKSVQNELTITVDAASK